MGSKNDPRLPKGPKPPHVPVPVHQYQPYIHGVRELCGYPRCNKPENHPNHFGFKPVKIEGDMKV
jgi:hypothetical protein